MTGYSENSTKKSTAEREPLTYDEILRRDNIPASEPIPADIADRFADKRIFLFSDEKGFDPRKNITKVKGSTGTWVLSTTQPVVSGLPVEKVEQVEPGSMRRNGGKERALKGFRPPWQPYIYHPKTVPQVRPQMLQRKSGAKILPEVVFNNDDRQLFFPSGYPWHCIGKVVANPGGSGTGTLVGSRTVLTCAHLIPWGAPFTITFFPAFWSWTLPSLIPLSAPLGGLNSFGARVRGYTNYRKSMAHDLAVVRLQDPLGDILGTFGATIYNDDWEDDPRWTMVGYPTLVGVTRDPLLGVVGFNNNGNMPARQFGISVEDDDSDGDALELEHHGDSTPGNSGGPLFGHWPDGPYVIGVHSGSESDASYTVAAGGRAMRDLVNWARANWV